jgi:tetratricopeptide (TPR) repeat protein
MKFTLRVLNIVFVLFCFPFLAHAQLLNDPTAIKTVQKSLDHIYNYEFDEATRVIDGIEKKYPNHPINHILDSFVLYWKYLPIKDNQAKSKEYIQKLNLALIATEKRFGKDTKDPEGMFYVMVARGYMAMMYNYRGEMLSAAGEGKKAYNAFIDGMKLMDKNPEFYFTSGMYNYYVEVYPEEHPMVKPLLMFFKNGNKALGLKQVDIATRSGVITRAESCFYLAHLYMKYEMNPEKAVPYVNKLTDWYPKNPLFIMKNIEALSLAGDYDDASKQLVALRKYNTGFYPIAQHTFQGINYEKHLKSDVSAQKEYLAALRIPHDDQYTKEYHAMAYAGLARIAGRAGNKAKAKEYYKKCLEKAEYRSLMKEAKAFK